MTTSDETRAVLEEFGWMRRSALVPMAEEIVKLRRRVTYLDRALDNAHDAIHKLEADR